jgi:hypothetical protein
MRSEQVRVDLGQRRNVIGVLPFFQRSKLVEGVVDRSLWIGRVLLGAENHSSRRESHRDYDDPPLPMEPVPLPRHD